ncbi:hypothetical protein MRY87_01735 [bacterium]|nr:hypothetical protein [bacterium]
MVKQKSAESKEKKTTAAQRKKGPAGTVPSHENDVISTNKELKEFLLSLRDRMTDGSVAAVTVVSAMHYVLSIPNIGELLTKENKEISRDIWLRVKQAGVQLRNPPLLFDADEEVFSQGATR